MKYLLITLLLAGCADMKPVCPVPPEVKVEVPIPCVKTKPVRPTSTFGVGVFPGDKTAAQVALIDKDMWESYADQLEAAYAGCAPVQ